MFVMASPALSCHFIFSNHMHMHWVKLSQWETDLFFTIFQNQGGSVLRLPGGNCGIPGMTKLPLSPVIPST